MYLDPVNQLKIVGDLRSVHVHGLETGTINLIIASSFARRSAFAFSVVGDLRSVRVPGQETGTINLVIASSFARRSAFAFSIDGDLRSVRVPGQVRFNRDPWSSAVLGQRPARSISSSQALLRGDLLLYFQ